MVSYKECLLLLKFFSDPITSGIRMWKYKKKRGIYESEPDGLENWVRGQLGD